MILPRRVGTRTQGPKTAELVAARIIQAIVTEKLRPGTRLPPEQVMLEMYGVSRSSLREALRILEVNGLISLRAGPQGGPIVGKADPSHFAHTMSLFLEMSNTTFAELMQARVAIEPMMARLAAEEQQTDRFGELETSLEDHRKLDPTNVMEYLRVSDEFHRVISGLSGNTILDLFGRSLSEIIREPLYAVHHPAARWSEIRREHEAVAAAIFAGDGAKAEELMKEHMVKFAASFSRRYRPQMSQVIGWQ